MGKFVPNTIKLYQDDVKDDKDKMFASNLPKSTIYNNEIQKFTLDEDKQSTATEIYVKNESDESIILTPAINIPNLVEIKFEHGFEFCVQEDGTCIANVSLVFYDYDKKAPSYVHFDKFPLKKLDESKMPVLLSA